MKKNIEILVDTNKYNIETIRYSTYTFTDRFYINLSKVKNNIKVSFEPKSTFSLNSLKKDFLNALEEEKIRNEIFNSNKDLREYLILNALNYKPQIETSTESALTEDEEKELDKLIAEVEGELKEESLKEDPLEIKKTWEEKYGNKNKSKKSK